MRLKGSNETMAMHGNRAREGMRHVKPHDRGAELSLHGSIETVYFSERMPSVDVNLVRGGLIKFLSYPGATIDRESGNLHGFYVSPIKGQRVVVSFADGNLNSPYISELIFRAGESADAKFYKNFAAEQPFKQNDIVMSHKSGVYIRVTDNEVLLGTGGVAGAYSPVAVVEENKILTAIGLQPILPALTRVGPLVMKVKA